MGKVDEFNNYGINNPDGVQHGYTDYKKWSFDNDTKLASVKELPTAKVKEYSSYNEYPAVRQKDAPNNRNVKVDNTQAQQQLQDVANQQAAATQTATSAATATTQVAAASTTLLLIATAHVYPVPFNEDCTSLAKPVPATPAEPVYEPLTTDPLVSYS